eukprot:CAMPEP_0174848582 /NCGR_PEP_ID=MMETSP1114-20130205/13605_1 /TAXON_ID=312471 /ORGANISM="Neobodo designis, Strain CCAP 1951/1" /LENGTH=208 /DNA_ID=CAMNT_0016082885 /DNA_START=68 /DNA_END=694 /DNA_ORIENTATION=+
MAAAERAVRRTLEFTAKPSVDKHGAPRVAVCGVWDATESRWNEVASEADMPRGSSVSTIAFGAAYGPAFPVVPLLKTRRAVAQPDGGAERTEERLLSSHDDDNCAHVIDVTFAVTGTPTSPRIHTAKDPALAGVADLEERLRGLAQEVAPERLLAEQEIRVARERANDARLDRARKQEARERMVRQVKARRRAANAEAMNFGDQPAFV